MQLGTGDATRALQVQWSQSTMWLHRYKHGMPAEIFDCERGRFSTPKKAGNGARHSDHFEEKSTSRDARDLQNQALETMEQTVELARVIEKCGVSAFGVHGRYVGQRPRDAAHWDQIKQVVESVSCPVIANGDVFEYSDFGKIRAETGAAAAMCGRGAMWNQSIFRKGA